MENGILVLRLVLEHGSLPTIEKDRYKLGTYVFSPFLNDAQKTRSSICRTCTSLLQSMYFFDLPSETAETAETAETGKTITVNINHLPSLKKLRLPLSFNQPVSDRLSNLTHLILGMGFDQQLENLPPTLLHLTVCSQFYDRPLKNLPPNLESLAIGYLFNQPISKEDLPSTLTHLRLAGNFNQPLNSSLPPNLLQLELGPHFNQPLRNLPQKLTHLTIDRRFNQPFDDDLPPNLVSLILGQSFNQPFTKMLPLTLEVLRLYHKYSDLNWVLSDPFIPPSCQLQWLF